MAEQNLGKDWEKHFKQDWLDSVPNASIDRLYDNVSGYKGVVNISDFIGYSYPNIFYLECKSHRKTSFPFSCLSQYDDLTTKVGIKGVRAGIILWMIDLKEIYYVPISTITKIKDDGVKSFNPKNCSYPFYIVPGEWKRKFKKCDYNFMLTLQEGE